MKNDPKVLQAWCFYDWANSVHALVIVSAIFPVYYNEVSKSINEAHLVSFFGYTLKSSVLFSYSIALSFLLIAFTTPILTAIADYSGLKKTFMRFFVYLGAFSSSLLFFFTAQTLEFSVILFALSLIGYSGSIVFYNAYLPEIASEDRYDYLSARGFTYGYIGSVLLLLFNLSMLLLPNLYGGISADWACRVSFLTTGLWWFGFAQYTLAYLPKGRAIAPKTNDRAWLLNGFRELIKVLKELKTLRLARWFLLGFFFYNMGVQTVMYIAAIFGAQEIGVPDNNLILTILIIQLLAIVGAYGFAYLSKIYGNTRALEVAVLVWVGICVSAYYINELGFYILAVVIGFVMGGIQSLSRSTYAKLLPPDTPDRASYFGFYDVVDKLAIVSGTFVFGFLEHWLGSVRYGIIALAVFFVLGFICLLMIPSRQSYRGLKSIRG